MPRTTSSAEFSQLLGSQLRRRRLALRLSQTALAHRLDVSATYVQNVEAGRSNLTVGQLQRFCRALDAHPAFELVPLENRNEISALDAVVSMTTDG